jgi:hypothetical protein
MGEMWERERIFSSLSNPSRLIRRHNEPSLHGPKRPPASLGLHEKREGESRMRFMIIVRATKDSEAGVMPTRGSVIGRRWTGPLTLAK